MLSLAGRIFSFTETLVRVPYFLEIPPGCAWGILLEGRMWLGVNNSHFCSFSMLDTHAQRVCDCVVAPYLTFLDFGIADTAQSQWLRDGSAPEFPPARLWHSQILWVLPQTRLRMVKTSPCAQPGEKEVRGVPLSSPSPKFPDRTVELEEFGICYQRTREKQPRVAPGEVWVGY